MAGNAAADWAGELGARWAQNAAMQDALIGRFEAPGVAALGPVEGRRVLDLGCGPGESSATLADLGAHVTAVDVSPDLVALARRRLAGREVEVMLADAATHPFAPGSQQALFSRFGAMFFEDPVPAWTNLRAAMAPDAPLAVVAWRSIKENPWAGLPLRLIADMVPPQPKLGPGAPGPFGWADPAVFTPWLEAAGWREVRAEPGGARPRHGASATTL